MKRFITNTFYLLIVLIGLTSCEGNTTTEKIIVNNSSTTISVQVTDDWGTDFNGDIADNDDEIISSFNRLGGSSTAGAPATGITSFTIVNANGDSLTKDFMLETNWNTEVIERSSIPADYLHRHTFTVTDGDF